MCSLTCYWLLSTFCALGGLRFAPGYLCSNTLLPAITGRPQTLPLGADTRGSEVGETSFSFSPVLKPRLWSSSKAGGGHPQLAADERPVCEPFLTSRAHLGEGSVTQIPSGFGKITLLKPFPGRIWGNFKGEDYTDSPLSTLQPGP